MPDPRDSTVDRATVDELLEAVGGDVSFLAALVDALRVDAPTHVTAMRAGLVTADADQVARAAHTLKSSSAALGAAGLAALCAELEARARSDELDGAEDAVSAIDSSLAGVLDELARLVGTG